jgi:hypothetical protein
MFQHINEYPWNAASPGGGPGCFTCGAPNRTTGPQAYHDGGELIVELGVETDVVQELDGTAHSLKVCALCETCIRELASMIGCDTPEEHDRLHQANQSMAARLADYEAQEVEWEEARKVIARARVDA